jgi:hypothetical protein
MEDSGSVARIASRVLAPIGLRLPTTDPATAPRLLRVSALMSTAFAMTAAVAHLLELPAKRRYEPGLYVRLHRTLYWNFGRITGPAEGAAVLTTGVLAWWRRRGTRTAFTPPAVAAGCVAAAHGIFWAIVNPVNVEMVRWPLQAIPDNWAASRDRWEYGHAVRACLLTAAFATLAWSIVDEED